MDKVMPFVSEYEMNSYFQILIFNNQIVWSGAFFKSKKEIKNSNSIPGFLFA